MIKMNEKVLEMTRKELAELIVEDQIKRGVIKEENRDFQINARLKGCGSLKAMSKRDLLNGALALVK